MKEYRRHGKAWDSRENKSWKATTGEALRTKDVRLEWTLEMTPLEKAGYVFSFSLASPSVQHWTQYEFAIDFTLIDYELLSSPSSAEMLPRYTDHIWDFLTSFAALQPAEKNCSVPEQWCISPQPKYKSPSWESCAFPWIVTSLPSVLFITIWEVFPLPFPFPKAIRQ